jgi:hypothetical protein
MPANNDTAECRNCGETITYHDVPNSLPGRGWYHMHPSRWPDSGKSRVAVPHCREPYFTVAPKAEPVDSLRPNWHFLPSVRYESDLPPNPADDDAIMVLTAEPGASLGYQEGKIFVGVGGQWKELAYARP